jgi:hypothetical protein
MGRQQHPINTGGVKDAVAFRQRGNDACGTAISPSDEGIDHRLFENRATLHRFGIKVNDDVRDFEAIHTMSSPHRWWAA